MLRLKRNQNNSIEGSKTNFSSSTNSKASIHTTMRPERLIEDEMQQDNDDNDNILISIDEAIDRLGHGFFQQRILFAAGLCSASDAMEILLLSFLSFSVQVEWDLTDQESNSIVSAVFFGAFFGSLILGKIGDVCGRKPAFLITAAIVAIFGLVTIFCQTYWQLLLARFLVGVGIGGNTVPFDTYYEFLPTESRGRNLVLPSYFWTTGTVLIAIIAHQTLGQDSSQWRNLCLWCSIPCIIATIVATLVVPESPRWLLANPSDVKNSSCFERREAQAFEILRNAARYNGKDPDNLFPLNRTFILQDKTSQRYDQGNRGKTDETYSEIHDGNNNLWIKLLSPKWYRISITIWIIWTCYAFLYYGSVLIVTLIFSSASPSPYHRNDDANNSSPVFHFDYVPIIISTFSEVVGATCLFLTIDRFGRKKMHRICFLLGGILSLTLCIMVNNNNRSFHQKYYYLLIIIAFITRLMIFSGSVITWIWTAELFSTELRSTGHSVANAAARIGGFLSPYLVSRSTTFLVIGFTMLGISLVIYFLNQLLCEPINKRKIRLSGAGELLPSLSYTSETIYQNINNTDETG